MLRTLALTALLTGLLAFPITLIGQCLVAPPLEDCNGTEPLLTDNETLVVGAKKWFYGAAATYNSVTLRGGTLIVCGNLTFTNFTMDSGTIVIRPGAWLRIGGGAGIILRGNSSIYNHGTFECLSNLSLDPTWATPAKPNVVINATPSSFFKMSNQYFVINNANSFFVNRGRAEFWGIITDYGAGMNSVCQGRFAEIKMAVLYNNRKDTYDSPEGASCVSVFQYSQFRDTLTNSHNLNICLSAGHNSDASCIPFGCKPNAWGTPHIFQFCDLCSGITLLRKDPVQPSNNNNLAVSPDVDVTISPNPFFGQLTIRWTKGAPKEIQVRSLTGELVLSQRPARSGNSVLIQLPASLPAGTYLVRLIYDRKVVNRQVTRSPLSP